MELKLEIIRNQITKILNDSQLPVGAAYYLIKDIYRDIEDCYKQAIQVCQQQSQEEKHMQLNIDADGSVTEEEV